MREILTKIFARSRRGPYISGLVSPLIAIIFFATDYHINEITSIVKITDMTIYGIMGFLSLFLSPFVMGVCSETIRIVFLKHNMGKKSIRDSFRLLINFTQIFSIAVATFVTLIVLELIIYGKFITLPDVNNFDTNLLFTLHMIVLFVIMMNLIALLPRFDPMFRFGYARICLKFAISDETEELEKLEYLSKGIISYNFFLGKYSDMEMKNPDTVSSRLMCEKAEERKYSIERLEKSFDRGDLGPLEQIKKIITIKNPEEFFVKRQRFYNIRQLIPIVGTIITVIYFGGQFLINVINEIFPSFT